MTTITKAIDLVNIAEHPAAVIGMTGSGKTFATKGIVESLLDLDRRVIIIDPTGAWFGLRSGADGTKAGGFPVLIFGGDHADIPLLPEAGKEIAEMLAERHVQCILDVSDMTGGERSRFMAAFLETMFIKNRTHLHLIVDEADDICPQKPMPGQERMKGAFDKVVRKGRRRGFIPLMITQRPAVIDKSVLSQAGAMIILKLMSPQDQAAIKGWVEGNVVAKSEASALMSSLSTLTRGTGWVWAPAEGIKTRVAFPKIRTFDSSRTPEVGEEIKAPVLSDVDVKALRSAMSQIAAAASANEKTAAAPADKVDLVAAEKRGYERGHAEGRAKGAEAIRALMDWMVLRIGDFQAEMKAQFDPVREEAELPDRFAEKPADHTITAAQVAAGAVTSTKPVKAVPVQSDAGSDLTPALQRALDAIEWWHRRGFATVERKRAAILCGLSPTASTFHGYISKLKDKGLLSTEVGEAGHVALTAAGRAIATGGAVESALEAARGVLSGQALRVFDIIAIAYPKAVARNDIADAMGLSRTASTLHGYISKVASRGLIENHGAGMVRAADFIFE